MPKRLSRPRAWSTRRRSSPIQSLFPSSAPQRESPRLCGPATSRFSITVSRANSDGSWNVRTRPRRARAYAGIRVTSWPSKMMRPPEAGSVPARTARNVDLPAPLGPIKPVIFPAGTSMDTPSTANTPSKCRYTSEAASKAWSGIEDTFWILTNWGPLEHAPRLRPYAFRPEPEEPDDEQADRHPLHGRDEIGRRYPAADGGWYQPRRLLETHGHQQRTEDGTEVVAAAADDHRGEKDDGLGIKPDRRSPYRDVAHQNRPRKPCDDTPDNEDRHLELDLVLADGGGRHLVLAHRPRAPAEGRVDDP